MLFLGALIGGPFIGWCSDKLGLRVLPMKIGVMASIVILVITIFCPVPLAAMKVLFFLLGFFTAAQIISYALVAESSPSSLTATAVGVVSLFVQGGYIVYQNIFGLLLTAHGEMQMLNGTPVYSLADYQHAALILPLGLLLAYFALSGLKETHGQQFEG
jgi:MFS family permease